MADFETAVKLILKHEGGYVNNSSDPGGATNRGITFMLFKQYADALSLKKTLHDLMNLTEDQAKFIYREEFWDKMKGDQFKNQQVANIVFDGYVNMGGKALKLLQKEVGAWVDGQIGNESLQAINGADPRALFNGYKDARIKFYENLVIQKPKLAVFKKGWLNRINSFVYAP